MNSPDPIAAAKPDPTTPGSRPAPTALGAATATALAGTPPAVLTVWLLETYGTAHGVPLKFDSVTATAIGSVGAALMGYLYQLAMGLLALVSQRGPVE